MSSRLTELYDMLAEVTAEIAREEEAMWRMARLRDNVNELLERHAYTTALTLRTVADRYGVNVVDILRRDRRGVVVEARHVTCWLLRDQAGLSYPAIGKVMGRDHATVMAACRRINGTPELLDAARGLRDRITEELRDNVTTLTDRKVS